MEGFKTQKTFPGLTRKGGSPSSVYVYKAKPLFVVISFKHIPTTAFLPQVFAEKSLLGKGSSY